MKSTLSGFLLLMISRFALSQNALTDDPMLHKNQLGINASYFVSQFINFDGFDYYQYPSYMLYYRRILAPGNIRVAFGANYNSEEIVSRYDYDSTLYTNIDYDVAFSAGWEWDTPISKKWWVYYGADIGTFMQFENYEADNFDDGYAISTKTKDLRHSIGPFIGVRFDLTPRISLTTETNLKINFNTVDVHRTYTPTSSDYPELPDETDPTQKSLYTGYEVPYTLVLTIDL